MSLVAKEVKPEDLEHYIAGKGFTVINVNSYKLTVPVCEFDKLFDSSLWPEGILIRRFNFASACDMMTMM